MDHSFQDEGLRVKREVTLVEEKKEVKVWKPNSVMLVGLKDRLKEVKKYLKSEVQ